MVILNGPAGVGKTTVGRLLAERFPDAACVHGDDLKNFIVRRTDNVRGQLGYRNGGAVAGNFIGAGYQMVVFDYVFEHPDGISTFVEACAGDAPIYMFTLWASLETIEAREQQRIGRHPLGERVQSCYVAMHKNLANLGRVVSTEERTPAEVVDTLVAHCRAHEGVMVSADASRRDAA